MSKNKIKSNDSENMSESSQNDSNVQQVHQFQSDSQQASRSSDNNQRDKKQQELLQIQQKRIKQQLKDVSFGQLLKYKKLKQEVAESRDRQVRKDRSKRQLPNQDNRTDKNAPRQIKIMKRPPKNQIKNIFQSDKPKSIDPRFQSYTGSFNADLATKSYAFIEDVQKNQVNYLKKQIKNKKLKDQDREVLLKNYNKITNDMKRFEHQNIERKVKHDFRASGNNYVPKKRQFKQHVQKAKLDVLDSKSQDKRLKKKQKKIQKQRTIERKKFMSSTYSK